MGTRCPASAGCCHTPKTVGGPPQYRISGCSCGSCATSASTRSTSSSRTLLATVAMLHKNECGFQPMTNPDGESLAQRGQKIDERTCTIRAESAGWARLARQGEPAGFLRGLGVPWAVVCRGSGACSRRRGSSSLSSVGRSWWCVGGAPSFDRRRMCRSTCCTQTSSSSSLERRPVPGVSFAVFLPKLAKLLREVVQQLLPGSRGLGESAAAARTPTSRWPIRPEHEKHEPLGQVHWLRLHQRTRRLPEPAHRNSAPDGCSGCGSSVWLHRHPQLPDGNHNRGALGHSSYPAAARPAATAVAAGRSVHEETAFECAAPSLCPQPRPARAVDAGDQRAVSWAAVVLSFGVLPADLGLPSHLWNRRSHQRQGTGRHHAVS